ncbi:hypothetical protein BSKO_02115 [Bryopsis sp. KO-2023]|nr:hypothetical protein BSKO_02115 [Bryopsis sp. KO-2023]
MNLRHIEDNPEQRKRLANVIGTQLKKIFSEAGNIVPDELVEYIVVLLAHGKPRDEVALTLVDFLHDGAQPFAEWLFKYIDTHGDEYAPKSREAEKSKTKRSWQVCQDLPDEQVEPIAHARQDGRLRSAISIPEQTPETASQGPAKRSRRHSPVSWENEHGGNRNLRKTSRGSVRTGSDDRSRGRERGGDGRDHKQGAHKRLFANAMGAVSAQIGGPSWNWNSGREHDEGFEGGRYPEGGLRREPERPPPRDNPGPRSRSVFDRLGRGASSPRGEFMGGSSGDEPRKDKLSVFERLEGRRSGMDHMEAWVDVQNNEPRPHLEPIPPHPSTHMMDHHSPQELERVERVPDMPNPSKNLQRNAPHVPPHLDSNFVKSECVKDNTEKMSEIQRLRERVVKMQSNLESLRARTKVMASREDIAKQDVDNRSVCVQNVHFMANKEVVAAHFSACGRILEAVFPLGPFGSPKGYCFVEFERKDSVEKAIQLSGTLLMGRMIKVIRKMTVLPPPPTQAPHPGFTHGMYPGRGFKHVRPPYGRGGTWPARGGRWGRGRGSLKLVRATSDVQDPYGHQNGMVGGNQDPAGMVVSQGQDGMPGSVAPAQEGGNSFAQRHESSDDVMAASLDVSSTPALASQDAGAGGGGKNKATLAGSQDVVQDAGGKGDNGGVGNGMGEHHVGDLENGGDEDDFDFDIDTGGEDDDIEAVVDSDGLGVDSDILDSDDI